MAQKNAIPRLRCERSGTVCEKRRGQLAIPLNLRSLINKQQVKSLRQMESFGWRLAFIRRSHVGTPEIIVQNLSMNRYGLLDADGRINTNEILNTRTKTHCE